MVEKLILHPKNKIKIQLYVNGRNGTRPDLKPNYTSILFKQNQNLRGLRNPKERFI
jgi:hypothetical protein